jgi:CheY-like chemotaxis protein
VKQSGGHIWVYSELGRGSVFKIYLPVCAHQREEKGLIRTLEPRRGSETVLLVEDEEDVRRLANTVLARHGYKVLAAADGLEALRISSDHPDEIHLLITDVVMPNMSGRELAGRMRSLRPGIKVLYMSGYTDDAVVRHGVLDATDHFLQKPFTVSSFVSKVRELLGGDASGAGSRNLRGVSITEPALRMEVPNVQNI